MIGYWRQVPEWSLAGNDRYGDCTFATAANFTDLLTAVNGTPEVVPEGEAEYWYAKETGWTAQNPDSDKGEILEKMLQYWLENGNPSDPVDRITSYAPVANEDITVAIERYGACFAWCMLPMRGDDDPDLSDDALQNDTPGTAAHAMLIVGTTPKGFVVVTWGEACGVSRAWWYRYGRQQFSVEHPAWPLGPQV